METKARRRGWILRRIKIELTPLVPSSSEFHAASTTQQPKETGHLRLSKREQPHTVATDFPFGFPNFISQRYFRSNSEPLQRPLNPVPRREIFAAQMSDRVSSFVCFR